MTTERFNEIINGPLHHPMPMLAINRLVLALRIVVDQTGSAGDVALEFVAAEYAKRDGE
jgi:hypothetical protein